jgi:hypothetical protein
MVIPLRCTAKMASYAFVVETQYELGDLRSEFESYNEDVGWKNTIGRGDESPSNATIGAASMR